MNSRNGLDPRCEDALALATAAALADAAPGGLRTIERAAGISRSRACRWRREGRGSPIHYATMVIHRLAQERGTNAHALVAHFRSVAIQGMLHAMRDEALVERFWDLMRAESVAEGRENAAQADYARAGDLEALERATLAEAALQEELGAVIRELRRRRIDPRSQRAH